MRDDIENNFDKIIKAITNGEIVVMKSDTIYGIFCSALNKNAVKKLHEIRNRDKAQGFIVLCDNVKTVEKMVKLKPEIRARLENIWRAPNATSVILSAENLKENWLADMRENQPRICFRVPHDKIFRKLLAKTGPLCAPSANLAGQPPAQNISKARDYFGKKVDLYVDGGESDKIAPSRIIKFNKNHEVEIVRTDNLTHPEDFIISRKRKQYKFAIFDNDKRCFDLENWQKVCEKIITKNREIILEVGAGSALFSTELARLNPNKIFIATDIKSDRLYRGARRADELNLKNIFFVRCNVSEIDKVFPQNSVSEIWITFPDPFAKENYQNSRAELAKFYRDFLRFSDDKNYADNLNKYRLKLEKLDKVSRANFRKYLSANSRKRLTNAKFLEKYKNLLKNGGIINFKTDNSPLFEWSLENFAENNFEVKFLTRDLHNLKSEINLKIPREILNEARIMTSYEERFSAEFLATNYVSCCNCRCK